MTTDDLSGPLTGVAIVASSIAKLEKQLDTMGREQRESRDLLIGLRESSKSLATKAELAEQVGALKRELIPVAAQAKSAHERLDGFDIDLSGVDKRVTALEASAIEVRGRREALGPWSRFGWTVLGGVTTPLILSAIYVLYQR